MTDNATRLAVLLERVVFIREIASGYGGDEASRTDPRNALTTIVINCDEALAAAGVTVGPSDPARAFGYWFTAQPLAIQWRFVSEWLSQHPENAARLDAAGVTVGPSLDVAWARAEAALPEGWHNGPYLFGYDVDGGGRAYVARVESPNRRSRHDFLADGDSPAAALHALAALLEEKP